MTIYSMDKQGEPYIYNLLAETPLLSDYYYGLLRTLQQIVVLRN